MNAHSSPNLFSRLDQAAQATTRALGRAVYDHRHGLAFALMCAVVAYGYPLANFAISLDDEIFPFADHAEWYVAHGRFVSYYFRKISVPMGNAPYLPLLLGLAFVALTAWTLAGRLFADATQRYVFACLFCSSPVFAYLLKFSLCSDAVTFGLVFVAAACVVAQGADYRLGRWRHAALCSLLVALGVGSYQSVHLVYVAFAALLCLACGMGQAPGRARARDVALFGAVTAAAGLGLHMVGEAAFKVAYGFPLVSAYQNSMFDWSRGDPAATARHVWAQIVMLFGSGGYFPVGVFTRCAPWLAGGVAVVILARGGSGGVRRVWLLAALAVLVASPFLYTIALGHFLPVRSALALPLVAAGLACLGLGSARPFVRALILALVCLAFVNNTFTVTRLFYALTLRAQADRELAVAIADRAILALGPQGRHAPAAIAFVGKRTVAPSLMIFKTETFGYSIFEWDNGNPVRMHSLLRAIGQERFALANPEQQARAHAAVSQGMPAWPQAGAVRLLEGGLVVVNLGE